MQRQKEGKLNQSEKIPGGKVELRLVLGTGGGTSAFIVWVKGQQAVQAVLLFTPGDDPLWASRIGMDAKKENPDFGSMMS